MTGSTGSMLSLLLMLGLLWFLLIRPQQIQAKKRAEMLTALKAGDKIVTIGGICGTVKVITDTKVFVEVADGITIEMLRNSISQTETAETAVADEDEDDDEDYDDDDIYYDEDDDIEEEKKS